MKFMQKLLILVVVLFTFGASGVWGNPAEMADILIQAHNEGQPIPVLSAQYPEMDVETAYEVQKSYVGKRLAKEQIGGFKAGLTSAGGQKKFGVDAPLAGVLFESGKITGTRLLRKRPSKP